MRTQQFDWPALILIVGSGAVAPGALAGVTVYSSEAEFGDDANAALVVTFEEREWLPALSQSFFGSIASGGITFVPIASPPAQPNLFVAPPRQTNFCCPLESRTLTSSGGENIDLVFNDPPRAVGFTVYANSGNPIVYTLTLLGGQVVTFTSTQRPSTVGFVGFISDVPIAKLNWASDFGDVVNAGIDDVWVGEPACAEDLNGDGVVDAADLAILLGGWGGAGAADFNASGAVDAADLAIMLGAWGTCG